jgi:tRNA-specific 2-thiouridylase
VVDTKGTVLGRHDGIHKFTVGQRKGLSKGGTALPIYVQRIEPETRRVVAGRAQEVERADFDVRDPTWVDEAPTPDETVHVKIRHRHQGAEARVELLPTGGAKVRLSAPVRAVTPGQAAVFYARDRVLGGGFIS